MRFLLRIVGALFLALVVVLGWLYRHELLSLVRASGGDPAAAEAATGRPGTRALRSAREKIDSLNGWRADSVVLSPDEMAAVVGTALDRLARGQLDSLRVRLERDRVVLSALARTTEIPRETLGPLAGAIREWEPIEAAGPVDVARPGTAEWEVESLELRDVPIPRAVIERLLARILPAAKRGTVPLPIPRGIRDVRVRPDGVTLYAPTSS